MSWCRHNRDKPVENPPKYLPAIKYYLIYSQSVLKFETLAVHAVMRAYQPLCRKKKKSLDPSCDVSCISTNIQDGGQLKISSQNISPNKADIRIL